MTSPFWTRKLIASDNCVICDWVAMSSGAGVQSVALLPFSSVISGISSASLDRYKNPHVTPSGTLNLFIVFGGCSLRLNSRLMETEPTFGSWSYQYKSHLLFVSDNLYNIHSRPVSTGNE